MPPGVDPTRQVDLIEAAIKIHALGLYHKVPAQSTLTKWAREGLFAHAARSRGRGRWMITEEDVYRFKAPVMGKPRRDIRR